jgi:anthranilate phosphoribosyltransferase
MSVAHFIREIGRGKDGAKSLSEADAATLMRAVLKGELSDLELGAVVLALRMKGESVNELRGFLRAVHEHTAMLTYERPVVVIPSYNGARKLPNLVPLLALLLAREGVPVLVHGVTKDATRVTSYEVFCALGLPVAKHAAALNNFAAASQMREPMFATIESLSPALAKLLAVRQVVGVRNSGHTLAKLLAPFSTPCVRLVNYTHPEYAESLSTLFANAEQHDFQSDALLMRGTEGEAVADARRSQCIEWFSVNGNNNERRVLVQAQEGTIAGMTSLPVLPREIDAVTTAGYIQSVLSGEYPVPVPIEKQVDAVMQCVSVVAERGAALMQESTDTGTRNIQVASI